MDSQEICDRSSNSTEGDRFQEICDRSSNSTGTVDSEENSDQEVHRIGHVNLLETYATSRQKICKCSNSRGFHFFIFFQKKSSKVLKTCSKTGILNVCMLKPNAIIGGSFGLWRSFQIHKNQVLKNTVDRTRVHPLFSLRKYRL